VNVFLADEQDEPLEAEPIVAMAERILEAESMPPDTHVSIVLVGEDEMAIYNRRFMDRDGSTDVLAFPLEKLVPGMPPAAEPGGPPFNVGDIFVCPSVVRRQAADYGVTLERELALIVTHGLLHLLGYDHAEEEQALLMRRREHELMAMAGFDIR
jgi:probable rRNA maturation factor